MTVLDGSIVTVAMPAVQNDLGFSPAGLSWVVNAYLLAFGGLPLLAGRLGDLIALCLQRVLGHGAAATGLAMPPAAAVIGAVSLGVSARLSARFGDRNVLLLGLALLIALLGLLTRVPAHGHYATDLLPLMFLAAGFGLALPALTALGMSGAGEENAGLASGLFNTTQQIGMATGVAVLSTLAASRTDTLLAAGHDRAEALTGGYHLAFAVGGGLLTAAFLVALTVLGRPEPGTRSPSADRARGPEPETAHRTDAAPAA
ncbi:MFS transporter [Streptomyces sp. NPDC048680]|uniref:MFS transporter n=1 Tax=Streptomyces sp. NPDC048680 TaxID=3155492 RepID=UPI0034475D3C